MTYQLERRAVETFFVAQWGGATPVGMDGHLFEPAINSLRLTIQSGAVLQGSIGRALDRIDHIGVLQVQVFTEGGKGSQTWRGYVETIQGFLTNAVIDDAGVAITDPADAFVRFSPQNQHPYIAGATHDAPFLITTLNAPFVRYGFK
jgi:hypothetical protein